MNEQVENDRSTSRRRRRQNLAPGVSPGTNGNNDYEPSKRAADILSPAKAGWENKNIEHPGSRELRSLHPGLNSVARYAGSLSLLFHCRVLRQLLFVAVFLSTVIGLGVLISRAAGSSSYSEVSPSS